MNFKGQTINDHMGFLRTIRAQSEVDVHGLMHDAAYYAEARALLPDLKAEIAQAGAAVDATRTRREQAQADVDALEQKLRDLQADHVRLPNNAANAAELARLEDAMKPVQHDLSNRTAELLAAKNRERDAAANAAELKAMQGKITTMPAPDLNKLRVLLGLKTR